MIDKVLIHRPVMLDEVLAGMRIDPQGYYVDCTFGRGGHSRGIIKKLGNKGRLLAIDKDVDAVNSNIASLLQGDPRFEIEQKSFVGLKDCMDARGWSGRLSGVLMDLGVSSPQLETPDRGFSFYHDGPLDMRMDTRSSPSASEWLNSASEAEITTVLRRFGEERFSKRIAKSIVTNRERMPITRTLQLAELVERAVPNRDKKRHPATRTFQAIRIYVNGELEELKSCLQQAVSLLAPGGRLAVIAFHSLEDRIVKQYIREQCRGESFPVEIPALHKDFKPLLKRIGKAKKPSDKEIAQNLRARSAVLRIAEKLV